MQQHSVNLPVGYRFLPTDEEIVLHYLVPRLLQRPLPCDTVKDCNLYGNLEPWEIWSQYRGGGETDDNDDDLYVFTPLKKVTQSGSNVVRLVGSNGGSWHGEDSSKRFQSKEDRRIWWWQRRFKYYTKEDMERKRKRGGGGGGKKGESSTTGWIMYQFTLAKESILALGLDQAAVDSLAVCRIKKKEDKDTTLPNKRIKVEPIVIHQQLQQPEEGIIVVDHHQLQQPVEEHRIVIDDHQLQQQPEEIDFDYLAEVNRCLEPEATDVDRSGGTTSGTHPAAGEMMMSSGSAVEMISNGSTGQQGGGDMNMNMMVVAEGQWWDDCGDLLVDVDEIFAELDH